MPYVDMKMAEGTLLNDFKTLLTANGWKLEKTFKKIAYENALMNPDRDYEPTSSVQVGVAEHMIFSNSKGLYYGIAKPYKFEDLKFADIGQVRPTTPENKAKLEKWIVDKYKAFGKTCELYFYMTEKLPEVEDGAFFGCGVDKPMDRAVIDVEVYESTYGYISGSDVLKFTYTKTDPDIQQSPFVKCTLRNANLSQTNVATNWWPDSAVRVKGFVDAEYVFVVMQADSTPAFANNVVPTIPLYFGKFESFKEADNGNHALWGGTAFDTGSEQGSHSFDYKKATPYRNTLDFMPILKTYPNFPGNGIDNIIVKRSELGARYQAYYLSWNTAPQNMPPDRVGKDGGQYPLSWTTQDNDEYKYKFNPSMYSQKIHTSRAYLIHPDEGVRGYLPRMVILSPMGLVNEDKLKVRTATCPDKFDIYRFFLTSAISPVSKRPGTAYTPAGIGIYEKSI